MCTEMYGVRFAGGACPKRISYLAVNSNHEARTGLACIASPAGSPSAQPFQGPARGFGHHVTGIGGQPLEQRAASLIALRAQGQDGIPTEAVVLGADHGHPG